MEVTHISTIVAYPTKSFFIFYIFILFIDFLKYFHSSANQYRLRSEKLILRGEGQAWWLTPKFGDMPPGSPIAPPRSPSLVDIHNAASENGTQVTQRGELDGQSFQKSLEVSEHEVVARVPQSVAVHLQYAHRHHAVYDLLVDGCSRHEDHSV